MGRGHYSAGKRQRENEKARKKRDKADRRRRKRDDGPNEVAVVSAEDVNRNLPTIEEAMHAMDRAAARPKGVSGPPCRLFVGGLSPTTSDRMLNDALGKFGPVREAVVVKDRATGDSRGFGFVTMESRKHAAVAIETLDGTELDGGYLTVKIANARER